MSSLQYILVFLGLITGVVVAAQAGFNTHLGSKLGHPAQATLISFLIGVASIALFVLFTAPKIEWLELREAPWWSFLGGVCGSIILTYVIYASPKIGLSLTFALIVSGQVLAGLIFEHYGLLGYAEHHISMQKMLGALMLVGGVLLIKFS